LVINIYSIHDARSEKHQDILQSYSITKLFVIVEKLFLCT